jgi:alanyl-tRNA synthetase
MTADTLREKFLDFFKARKHKLVDSDSLVPAGDPTVLFTPAGMNQFKKEFLGFDSGFKRAATSQRCLRTDDLDKVGQTSSHHTFFEMLGNFSFGDYFKDEAILWAWEFLTKELKISEDKLWVSVYKDDDEAYDIWRNKIGVSLKKIVKLGDKDNFWPAEAKEKGPNGPCGPCSEIFYDFGATVGCGEKICDPSCSCGRFVEIWNLVFTQFNRKEGGVLEPLPNKNIDTGMGLERLVSVMEGKQSNFETDLFESIVKEIQEHITVKIPSEKEFVYAITDHTRAVVFCIYDGVLPSNEGRGYVVRKIIRKSVLHLRALGINKPLLNKLVPLVAEVMRVPYPDLKDRQEDIALVILNEENNFIDILNSREVLFAKIPLDGDAEEIGAAVFKLHDTHGFPSEEIEKYLKEQNVKDLAAIAGVVSRKFEEQRQRSKSQSKMKGDVFSVPRSAVEGLQKTQFLGYEQFETKAKVLRAMQNCDYPDMDEIVLDKTVFYAESGGQVSDIGTLSIGDKIFSVTSVTKIDGVFVHRGKKIDFPKKGDIIDAKIDLSYRMNVARNHTATHLLQAALRKVLGTHVQQQGSLVAEDKFRFDFTHFKGLSKEEITRVEEVANGYIVESQAVNCKEMALKEAKKEGALAFFEEKYAETVRVVSIPDISKELCGGTHIDNIAKIGLIKIISEGSVASGIRRIEGVTAAFAEQFIKDEQQRVVEEAKKKEKLQELKEQEKKRSLEVNNNLKDTALRLTNKGIKINDVNLIASFEDGLDMNALRLLADKLKEGLNQGLIVLGSGDAVQEKAYLVIAVTQDLLSGNMDAGGLIRQAAPFIGGSGGGRKDFAQAGGNNPQGFDQAFTKIKEIIRGAS